jgi:hypothetical protein
MSARFAPKIAQFRLTGFHDPENSGLCDRFGDRITVDCNGRQTYPPDTRIDNPAWLQLPCFMGLGSAQRD